MLILYKWILVMFFRYVVKLSVKILYQLLICTIDIFTEILSLIIIIGDEPVENIFAVGPISGFKKSVDC